MLQFGSVHHHGMHRQAVGSITTGLTSPYQVPWSPRTIAPSIILERAV